MGGEGKVRTATGVCSARAILRRFPLYLAPARQHGYITLVIAERRGHRLGGVSDPTHVSGPIVVRAMRVIHKITTGNDYGQTIHKLVRQLANRVALRFSIFHFSALLSPQRSESKQLGRLGSTESSWSSASEYLRTRLASSPIVCTKERWQLR